MKLPGIIRLMRPHHWTKNVVCFAGVLFGGFYGHLDSWLKASVVFLFFCLAASTVYVWNDILDRDRDKLHPVKRNRPIASGKVSVSAAAALGILLILVLLSSGFFIGVPAQICLLLYFVINVAYILYLKHVPLLDISCITSGFVLRVLAGIYPLGDTPTTWIVLCTMGLALLLATSKRRSELLRLADGDKKQRPVLQGYTIPYLDSLINSAATSTLLFYALFTILSNKNPTLVLTIPVVYYGIMRYKALVMMHQGAEEPEMILLKDLGIQSTIIVWFLLYIAILTFQPHWFR